MGYTLKSALASDMVALVAVDDDGTTIKDFVSGNTISLDSGVAASVATGSWKSITSPKYFVTTADGSFNFFGVRWTGTVPSVDQTDSDGMAAGFCCHGASNCSTFGNSFIEISNAAGNPAGLQRVSSSDAHGRLIGVGGGTVATTATNLPTDGATKFSFSANYRSPVSSEVFYGLESGSLASDGTAGSDGGFGGTRNVYAIGGDDAQGSQPFKPYVVWVARRFFTLAEHQAIHDDWRGFFFDSPNVLQAAGASSAVFTGAVLRSAASTAAGASTAVFRAADNPAGAVTGSGASSGVFRSSTRAATALLTSAASSAVFVGAALGKSAIQASVSSTATFVAGSVSLVPGALQGSGASSAVYAGRLSASGSMLAAGESSAAFNGEVLRDSTAIFIGQTLVAGVITGGGETSAIFAGQSVTTGPGALSGAGATTAVFNGTVLLSGVLLSGASSAAAFAGVSENTGDADLQAAGSATAAFIGSALAAASLAAAADSTATFASEATIPTPPDDVAPPAGSMSAAGGGNGRSTATMRARRQRRIAAQDQRDVADIQALLEYLMKEGVT